MKAREYFVVRKQVLNSVGAVQQQYTKYLACFGYPEGPYDVHKETDTLSEAHQLVFERQKESRMHRAEEEVAELKLFVKSILPHLDAYLSNEQDIPTKNTLGLLVRRGEKLTKKQGG